jgi:O-antigen/teichoic acid export membrane protein
MDAPSSAAKPDTQGLNRLIIKNTFYLTAAQALTVPLSVLMNAMMARYLGPTDFGLIYFASTLCGFALLIVEWGHAGALPALVARDRTVSGALLGTSVLWRLALSALSYVVLAAATSLLGYGGEAQWAIGLVFLGTVLTTLVAACKDTIRGFERTDIPAYVHVGQQLLTVLFVSVTLVVGGKLRSALAVQVVSTGLALAAVLRQLRPVGIQTLRYTRSALNALSKEGTPFVFFGLVMALQPSIDALYLSKLAPLEVMGWFAAARRLIGVLLFPAGALSGALYPTLCRLFTSDPESYRRASAGALQGITLLVVPVSLGCALYPDIGVAIFSRTSFQPAQDDLLVLSAFLFLVYFSMQLGTSVLAAGRSRGWTVAQLLCVLVSVVLDPILIPFFQKRTGNGGLGPCVAAVVSEVLVVVAGFILLPKGVLGKSALRSMALALASGVVMAVVSIVLRRFMSPFIAAPLAVAAYAVSLWATGGIEKSQIAAIRGFFGRKFSRAS